MDLPDFSGNFWAGVGIAAAVATALATGVSTFLSALWRWRDRAEPEWALNARDFGGFTNMGDRGHAPKVTVDVTNVGDGDAYKVTVTGGELKSEPFVGRHIEGRRMASVSQPMAVVRTGESFGVIVTAKDASAWDAASFTVSWWHAPTRRRRKWLGLRSAQLSERFYLRDLGDNPALEGDAAAV